MSKWSQDIKLDHQDYNYVTKADIASQSQYSSELGSGLSNAPRVL